MNKFIIILVAVVFGGVGFSSIASATAMTFNQAQWETGDMNEQSPVDSNGAIGNSHVDFYYYYERLPMRMAVLADSLASGSPSRTYDSAILALVVAADGLLGNDAMRIFSRRIIRDWSENGVSWNYHHASTDSAWTTAGGDFNTLPCTDTIIIDTSIAVYDTLYFHLDTAFVRLMIEGNNFGWMMMAENIVDRAVFQFFTEDVATAAYRPVLTVYYSDGTTESIFAGRRRRMLR